MMIEIRLRELRESKGLKVNTDKNIVISVTATFKPLVFDRVQFIQKYVEPFISEQ